MSTDGETFEARLAELERNGGNVLLIADAAAEQPCHSLLGDAGTSRLFVTTDGTVAPLEESLESDAFDVGHVAVAASETRSAEAATPAPGPADRNDWQHVVEDVTDLSSLAYQIHQELKRLANGDLTLCFDSLDPLVDRVDEQLLFRFLHVLTNRIKAAGAVAHYHLSAGADEHLRNLYRPLFDAVVEYRQTSAGPRQRWTVDDVQTDWLPVEQLDIEHSG